MSFDGSSMSCFKMMPVALWKIKCYEYLNSCMMCKILRHFNDALVLLLASADFLFAVLFAPGWLVMEATALFTAALPFYYFDASR